MWEKERQVCRPIASLQTRTRQLDMWTVIKNFLLIVTYAYLLCTQHCHLFSMKYLTHIGLYVDIME